MTPVYDHEFLDLFRKLAGCQDSRTGQQIFYGTVRIEYRDGVPYVYVDDPEWETDNDTINTRNLR